MAKSKTCNAKKQSYISVTALSSSSLQSLLVPPKKMITKPRTGFFLGHRCRRPGVWLLSLFSFALVSLLRLGWNVNTLVPFSPYPCLQTLLIPHLTGEVGFSNATQRRLASLESEFWKQPDGMGYRPCLEFSDEYERTSNVIMNDRRKYLLVVVSGGMNQQRNQIVDAVVIARILGAALVVPILQVNLIWGDESEFSDIFDFGHFKRVLADDVLILSSLPSTHIKTRPVEEKLAPLHVSPQWIRASYLKKIKKGGVLLLRGLDSRLSKDLPPDLQKLRCKVAFEALRFAPPILELGNKFAWRMQSKGPYLALHLRIEKDVWVRTGCLPGLSKEFDEKIHNERRRHPELLTARSNMTYHERKLAGLCPLNAFEVTRLLKALGAPMSTGIYWAGGEPLGGKEALSPLTREFPHFYNKEDLALPGELEPFAHKASSMAAIDYIVSAESNVFMPSHGGNMGHAIQGHRAFAGHKKYITPNKRHLLPYFLNSSLPEAEFNRIIRELHRESLGQPELRGSKGGRDVTKYPVPECMCKSKASHVMT
ncbi:hypothetical protein F3Y22_tig00112471pilonHSYRG00068 [Hibiscus syriacus]|uniref:O-fucosyltransferase family protein n=1 Tax=Hibiscus syriacus TaxID=106335 RepID=A0A6A2WY47_HIBSY|nr:O-fucosyltransferase 20-like isoform X2 [Hibiscus syriacus]KAE8666952.1 hypothetical protein F3Y22_tig00112471pilonHSYRG00068 [Hibiscus syriacus]